MVAKVEFDASLGAVMSCSEVEVTRESMRSSIREITGELSANDCHKLIVDVTGARISVSTNDLTFILDQLLTATHGGLQLALVIDDTARIQSEYASDYLSAEKVEVEIFSCLEKARSWIAAA